MTTTLPPAEFLQLVVGYDGSPPASRALDGAVRLLQGRLGSIDVVYVAHLSSLAMLSPGAVAEVNKDFDEIEQELRAQAAGQLCASGAAWKFERRQGIIADELIAAAAAIGEARSGETVAIIVGSSSHAAHRVVGSVAIGLARHSQVPLIIVP
jgi:nucleotide-binding universal stress UspA family protein